MRRIQFLEFNWRKLIFLALLALTSQVQAQWDCRDPSLYNFCLESNLLSYEQFMEWQRSSTPMEEVVAVGQAWDYIGRETYSLEDYYMIFGDPSIPVPDIHPYESYVDWGNSGSNQACK